MMTGLLALFLLLPSNSHATALSVMENTKVNKNAIFVSTQTKNGFIGLGVSTQSYNGAVANVGLYSSSNVVVSNTPGDNVVIYATGAITLGTLNLTASASPMLTTSTDTVSGAKTFVGQVSVSTWSASIMAPTNVCTGTAFCTCQSSQTVTIQSSTVTVWGSGSVGMNSAVNGVATVLEDGQFIGTETASKGVTESVGSGAGNPFNFWRVFTGRTPGQHTYCIGFWSQGSNTFSAAGLSDFQFGVMDVILR